MISVLLHDDAVAATTEYAPGPYKLKSNSGEKATTGSHDKLNRIMG